MPVNRKSTVEKAQETLKVVWGLDDLEDLSDALYEGERALITEGYKSFDEVDNWQRNRRRNYAELLKKYRRLVGNTTKALLDLQEEEEEASDEF